MDAVKETDEKPIRVGDGTPGPGRPKGSQNKTTKLAKDAIAAVAEGLGGVDRMIAWAKENPQNERVFWSQMYTKLLPLQVQGDADNPLMTGITVRFVRPGE